MTIKTKFFRCFCHVCGNYIQRIIQMLLRNFNTVCSCCDRSDKLRIEAEKREITNEYYFESVIKEFRNRDCLVIDSYGILSIYRREYCHLVGCYLNRDLLLGLEAVDCWGGEEEEEGRYWFKDRYGRTYTLHTEYRYCDNDEIIIKRIKD